MIIQIDHKSRFFATLAKLLLKKEVGKEIGYPVYHYPNSKYCVKIIKDEIAGFASMREIDGLTLFEYDYVIPSHRKKGIYGSLLKFREGKTKGIARIETCNDVVKVILKRLNYKPVKNNGSWTYFQKQL